MFKYLSQIGLHVLKVAVETGTFRAAAQVLNISQPAVSGHIHRIERELEVEIFERPYGRKLKLTEPGRYIYTYAVEVLLKNEELLKTTRELIYGELGQIKLAFSVGRFIMPYIIANFRKKHPGINFVLRTGNSVQIQKLVTNGEVDFGLSLFSDNPQINFKPFYREPMVMVCSSDHPLASYKVITKKDLDKYGIISGLYGSDYNIFIYNSFATIGNHNPNIIAQIEEVNTVLELVEEGGGISIVLQSAAQKALERGSLVQLTYDNNLKFPDLTIYQLYRSRTHLSSAVKIFIEFIYTEIPKRFPFITLVQ